jgi:hypothetical protein
LAKKEALDAAKEAARKEKEDNEAKGIKTKRVIKKKPDKEFEKLQREPLPDPKPLDVQSVLLGSTNWRNANTVAKKFSAGTTTTSRHDDKVQTFIRMNELAEDKGPLLPQSNFMGKKPKDNEDKFNRRVIKELNDISFDEDSDDYEEIRNLKRQPKTILNEENLKAYCTTETIKLDLESHYWLRNTFLDKIGRMSPNLRVLSLRRMKFIDNVTFSEIFKCLHKL